MHPYWKPRAPQRSVKRFRSLPSAKQYGLATDVTHPGATAAMSAADDEQVESRLAHAMAMLRHAEESFLDDLVQTCRGDPAFSSAFRRWEERLTLLKLQLHRMEHRLQHYLHVSGSGEPDLDLPPAPVVNRRSVARAWRERLEQWFSAQHIDTAYRRIENALDHDQEAMTADIITDLVTVAEIAEVTLAALADLDARRDYSHLEDYAFYRVLSPWRAQGMTAMLDTMRWLFESVREHEDW